MTRSIRMKRHTATAQSIAPGTVLCGCGPHLVAGGARKNRGADIGDQLQQHLLCGAPGIQPEIGGEGIAADSERLYACAAYHYDPEPGD